jgi:hypothetical protein
MNGISVKKAAMIDPMAQHTVVAIIEPVSSYLYRIDRGI